MKTPEPTPHTDWCGRGHHCGRQEHRSEPFRLDTPWGGLVASLVASATTGRAWLELRISVAIPAEEDHARIRAALIADEVDQAITAALVDADITYALTADPTLRAALDGDPPPPLAALVQGRHREATP